MLIIDFQLLLNADVAIIANSTFSWWAAYLNPNIQKVFLPRDWLGFRINKLLPPGIFNRLPSHWTIIDF